MPVAERFNIEAPNLGSPVIEAPEIEYYYDNHITEDDVPESNFHTALVGYLGDVLDWHYHEENWFISRNLYIYQTGNKKEKPAAPDIAVFIGVSRDDVDHVYIKSWKLNPPLRPAPRVVIEVASDATGMRDTDAKPGIYANLGVAEYIWYDPRPDRPEDEEILRGWRFPEKGRQQEMECDERGWLWSAELQSWLVPDGRYLRVCDRQGRRRLTREEALEVDNKAARATADVARAAAEVARAAAEMARAAAEAARAATEAERVAKEKTQSELNRARARLIELGIDPDSE